MKFTSPPSGCRSVFGLENASFGPTCASGILGGRNLSVERFDFRLTTSSFALSLLLAATAFALGVMENEKPSSERDLAPTLPNQESMPITDSIVCAGCEAPVLRLHSNNGSPLFDGRVCVECNDRVIAYRLELAIAEWKEKRREP